MSTKNNIRNTRKMVAFVLIISLLVGGFSTFALNGFAGTEGHKVTFTVDNDRDSYTVESEENEAIAMPKEIIPDDPKVSEGESFLGWKNLNAVEKAERDRLLSKKDLEDFVLTEDTEFEAIFEEETPVDDGEDEVKQEEPTQDPQNQPEEETEEITIEDDEDADDDKSKEKDNKDKTTKAITDLKLSWSASDDSVATTSITEEQGKNLTVFIPGENTGVSGGRKLVITYGHKDNPAYPTPATDTGFKLSNYTKELDELFTGEPVYDDASKTITYTLNNTYSDSTINLAFMANIGDIYNDEEMVVNAQIIEEGSAKYTADTATAKGLVINKRMYPYYLMKDPMKMKSGAGTGAMEFYYIWSHSIVHTSNLTLDFSGVMITSGGETKSYKEWIETGNSPFVFTYAGNDITGPSFTINKTQLEKSTLSPYFSIGYKTTSDFINGSVDFINKNLLVDYKYKPNDRGPWQTEYQLSISTEEPPENCGFWLYSSVVIPAYNHDIITQILPIPNIQPNSITFENDPDYGYLYNQYLFTAYIDSTRSAEDAVGKQDVVKFTIPDGVSITKVMLPFEKSKYDSVEISGDSTVYNQGLHIVNLTEPQKNEITMTFSGLQYVDYQSSGWLSLTDNTKIRFVGTTNNLMKNPSNAVSVETNGVLGHNSSLSLAQEGKITADPAVHSPPTFIRSEDGSTGLGGTINRGKSFTIQSYTAGSSYPYSNAYLDNVDNPYSPVYPAPVAYIDIPGGMEVSGATIGGSQSSELNAEVTNIFDNAGKWKDNGGKIVEVKISNNSGNLALIKTMDFYLDLKITVPQNYDEKLYGDSFEYSSRQVRWSSYDPNVIGFGTGGAGGTTINFDAPAGAIATVKDFAVVNNIYSEYNNKFEVVMPASAVIEGSTRVGSDYKTYVPGDPTTMPERHAGSSDEEFQFYLGYGKANSITDAKAYFVVPQGTGWKPELNAFPTVNKSGIENTEYRMYYTQNTNASNWTTADMDGSGNISATWTQFSAGDPIPLASITAFKYEFDKLDKSDRFYMNMPFEIPKVTSTSTIQYNDEAHGKTLYSLESGTASEGGRPALKVVQTDPPQVRESVTTGDQEIISSTPVNVEYGSAIPNWYDIATYDDFTKGIKLSKVEIEYTEQGKAPATATTETVTSFDSQSTYSPVSHSGIEYKEGYKQSVVSPANYVKSTSPGTFKIKYYSTVDADNQVGTAERTIIVSKNTANSIKASSSSIEYFYDQSASDVSGGSYTSWDKVFRSKLDIADKGLTPNKVDANNASNSVVLTSLVNSAAPGTDISGQVESISGVPGTYNATYRYTDTYGNFIDASMTITVKYRGDLKAEVKMGANPVNGASLTANITTTTGVSGSSTFKYEATAANPGYVGYYVQVDNVPAGYKMPASATRAGILNSINNNGSTDKVVETFNVSPVGITAVFEDNDTNKYMNSISLYKVGTGLVKSVNITDEGSYTFYPESGVFSGDYYMVAGLKAGYETIGGSDFTLSGGDVKTSDMTIANSDFSKTIKASKTGFNVSYYSLSSYTTAAKTYMVTYGDTLTDGTNTAPNATVTNDSHFVGWYTASQGGVKVDPATATMGAADINLYERHALNQYSITFKAGANGSFDGVSSPVTVSGITHGSLWADKVKASVPTPKADSNYYFAGWDVKLPNDSDPVTKSAVYTATFAQKPTVVFKAKDASTVTYNGTAQGEVVDVELSSGTLLPQHTLAKSTASAVGTNVGTYETTFSSVNLTGLVGAETIGTYYNYTFVSGEFKIDKRVISVKPQDKLKVFDGTVLKADTVEMISGSIPAADEIDYTNTKFTGAITEPGITKSEISPFVIKRSATSADVTSNYEITLTKGALEVTSATGLAVTVTGTSVTYDSTAYGLTDVKAKVAGVDTDATIYYSTKSATGPWDIIAPTFTEAGTHTVFVYADKVGYSKSQVKSGIVQIDRRTIDIKPIDVEVEYDGNSHNATKAGVDISDPTKDGLLLTQALSGGTFVKAESKAGIYVTTASGVSIVDGLSNDVTANYDITYTNGVLKINKSNDMTVVVNNKAVTYDSTAQTIDNGSSMWNGSSAGATIVYSTSENGSYSTTKPSYTDVGNYDIWAKASATANHQTSAAVKATLEITKKAISVKPQNELKTYDGTMLKADKVELVSGGLGVNDSYDMTNTTFTGSITDPGITDSNLTLKIKRTSTDADATNNYKITTTKGSLEIVKASGLAVVATGTSVTYDADAHGLEKVQAYTAGSAVDAKIYYSTKSATGPWDTNAPKFTEAGTHTVYVYAEKNGYTDSTVKNATVAIAQRIVTVKPVNVDVEYDGNSHVPASAIIDTSATTAKLVTGHALTGGTFVKAESAAGTYKTTASGVSIVDGSLNDLTSNYDVRYTNGQLKITRSDDMTAVATSKAVVYDSTAKSIDNGVSKWNNLDAGATIIYSTSENGTYSATKPSYTDVGTYDIWIKASATANYQTSSAVKATLDITQKAISVKPHDESKTFDNTPLTASSVDIISGGIGVNDEIDYTNTKFVGSIVQPGTTDSYLSPFKIKRSSDNSDATGNYKITTTKGSLEVVSAGGLTVKLTGTSVTYDSTAYGLQDAKAIVNNVATDATIYYSTKGATGPWDTTAPTFTKAGTHTVYVYAAKAGFNDSNVHTGIVQIDKRTIDIKPLDVNVEYDGNSHNATKAGVDLSDPTKDGLLLTQAIQGGTFVKAETNAGTYKTTVSGVSIVDSLSNDVTSNYEITYTNGVLKINKSDNMTVKATDKAITYDAIGHSINEGASYWNGSDAGATIVYSDSQNGVYSPTRPSYTNAGTYEIWVKASATANHQTSAAVKATLKINERVITVKPVDVEVEYDGNSHIPTKASLDSSSANLLVAGHKITGGTYQDAKVNAGTYKTTVSGVSIVDGGSNDYTINYDIKYLNGQLKINRSNDMTAVASNKTFTYDAQAKTIDNGSSLWNGADAGATMLYSDSQNGTYSATKPSYTDADSYDIWVKASATANHITSPAVKAVLKIDKRAITAKPKDESKTYDSKALTAKEVEVVIGDIPTNDAIDHDATTYTGTITNPGTEVSAITSLKINRKASGLSAVANYDVTLTRGSLEVVSAGGLAITIENDQVVYDGKTHSVDVAKANVNGVATTATIYYSKTGNAGTWDTTMPTFTDAGTHSVYAYAAKTGYSPSNVKTATMQIDKRDIELTPVDISKIYDGKVLGAVAYTIGGTGLADNESIDTQAVKYTGIATNVADSGQATSVDTSSVKIANSSKDTTANYKITSGNGKLTILKRNITLKPTNKTVTYNAKSHTADKYTIASGSLAPGQSIQASSVDYSGTRTYAGSNSDVKIVVKGVNILSGSTRTTDNYNISTGTGTVKVTKRSVAVSPVSRTVTANGSSHRLTDYRITSANKMAGGDTIKSVTFTNNSHSAAGTYKVGISKVTVGPSRAQDSYTFRTGTGTLTINAKSGGNDGGTTIITPPPTPPTNNDDGRGRDTTPSVTNVEPNETTTTDTIPVQTEPVESEPQQVESSIPSVGIGDNIIPLYNDGTFSSWALLNLVLMLGGAFVLMTSGAFALFGRRNKEDLRYDRKTDEYYEEKRKVSKLWMIAGIVATVINVLLFLVTQDMTGRMVLVDPWTIFTTILLVIEIIALVFTFRTKEEEYEDDDFTVN